MIRTADLPPKPASAAREPAPTTADQPKQPERRGRRELRELRERPGPLRPRAEAVAEVREAD
ncbi:MAG: hypothetical protein QOF20_1077, partial [Acidimicrobiaceae bacterium]|nr:hypothetical protein [Acidimicrobiaceae bacterium]